MASPSRTTASAPSVAPAHVAIIEARYYDGIMDDLLAGTTRALEAAGATYDVISMPGALEIAPALNLLIEADPDRYDAAIALGCVMRGETYHFDIVSNESARGLTDIAIQKRFPLGNGILTVENQEQAEVRADPARGDKGGEAVRAALALLRLKRQAGVR